MAEKKTKNQQGQEWSLTHTLAFAGPAYFFLCYLYLWTFISASAEHFIYFVSVEDVFNIAPSFLAKSIWLILPITFVIHINKYKIIKKHSICMLKIILLATGVWAVIWLKPNSAALIFGLVILSFSWSIEKIKEVSLFHKINFSSVVVAMLLSVNAIYFGYDEGSDIAGNKYKDNLCIVSESNLDQVKCMYGKAILPLNAGLIFESEDTPRLAGIYNWNQIVRLDRSNDTLGYKNYFCRWFSIPFLYNYQWPYFNKGNETVCGSKYLKYKDGEIITLVKDFYTWVRSFLISIFG